MPEGYQKRPGARSMYVLRSRASPRAPTCIASPARAAHGSEQLLLDGNGMRELILRHIENHESKVRRSGTRPQASIGSAFGGVSYELDESGKYEIYVMPMPEERPVNGRSLRR
jgi:hypothetical protein